MKWNEKHCVLVDFLDMDESFVCWDQDDKTFFFNLDHRVTLVMALDATREKLAKDWPYSSFFEVTDTGNWAIVLNYEGPFPMPKDIKTTCFGWFDYDAADPIHALKLFLEKK